jgi:hypothetical protein
MYVCMDMWHARAVASNHPEGTHVAKGTTNMCAAISGACNLVFSAHVPVVTGTKLTLTKQQLSD